MKYCHGSSWLAVVAICGCFAACDRTQEMVHTTNVERQSKLAGTAASARQVIDECRAAYQKLSSYEDEGFVRLAYRMKGEMLEDRAPLSVAFTKPGMLGIRAYSVEAGPTAGRWYLQLRDAGKSAVAGQVISRAIPPKADFAWLLSDPAVSEELAAGLAGFPPQLDMLLGPNAMRGLVDEGSLLKLDAPETVGGELCHVVQVTRGPAAYRLWIHQATMLLRRLQLPNVNLTAEMLADASITDPQLTIELPGIRTNQAINWQRFEIKIPTDSKLVSRFAPAPPPMQLERLGLKVPAFQLRDPQGKIAYSSSELSANKITVFAWMADHPACKEVAVQLAQVAKAVAATPAKDQVQFVNVWAEPRPAEGTTFDSLASQWALSGRLVVDSEAVGRDLFGVREAPTVVVLDGQNRVQIIDERSNPYLPQVLPELLSRLAGGQDLASEVLQRAQLDQQRHVAELWMAAAVDADRDLFQRPSSYPPRVVALIETNSRTDLAGDTQAIALSVDDIQMVWTLTSDGTLRREDPSTQAKREFRTRWTIDPRLQTRLEVSPNGQFLAFSQIGGRTVELYDTSIEQNRIVQLDASENVIDLHWMTLAGSRSPRLAVVTSNKQTKLLDPNNHEQLSGICTSNPLALVPQSSSDTLVGGYVVMEDRAIERLLLSSDSTHTPILSKQEQTTSRQTNLGRPAAFSDQKSSSIQLPGKKTVLPTKVTFQPAVGPWKSVETPQGSSILARGWIAEDEPAVFLLNEQLQQQWHYPLPLVSADKNFLIATANIDPGTGQPLWAITQANEVVHLLRSDGIVMDHVHFDEPVRGLGLVPVGNRLVLYVAHAKRVVTYKVGNSK